jgi:hypothetical protein
MESRSYGLCTALLGLSSIIILFPTVLISAQKAPQPPQLEDVVIRFYRVR